MMYEMRRTKPKFTLLPAQGICKLPYHIVMVLEELAFDGTVREIGCSTAKCYSSDQDPCPVPRVTYSVL